MSAYEYQEKPSDTPRTDENVNQYDWDHCGSYRSIVMRSRALERDLAAVTADRDALRADNERMKALCDKASAMMFEERKDHWLVAGDRDTLKAKCGRQRTELRRLNKTLRAMWDGVRFSARVKRNMETPK